jgi:hypothetical protein
MVAVSGIAAVSNENTLRLNFPSVPRPTAGVDSVPTAGALPSPSALT